MEKAMATHSITLAWKIPWTEERGRLPFMGSQRVEHDFTFLSKILVTPPKTKPNYLITLDFENLYEVSPS